MCYNNNIRLQGSDTMNKEIYPLYIYKILEEQFGDWLPQIKQAYNEDRIEGFVDELFKNPINNSHANTVTDYQISCSTQRFIAVFEWLKNKQIYKFDSDLWELIQNVEKLEIRSSVFKSLPFNTFWIAHDFENGFSGCMVIYGECNDGNYLKLIFINDTNSSYMRLPLRSDTEGKTLEEIIEMAEQTDNVTEWYKRNMRAVLNAIVYLCTDKPDISTYHAELPPVAPVQRTKKNNKKKKTEKKNITSISNVGLTLGRYIRETRKTTTTHNTAISSGVGSTKSPHMRKAHYHSFWVKDGDKKKLIVKFLSPIFVNGGIANAELRPTIRQKGK